MSGYEHLQAHCDELQATLYELQDAAIEALSELAAPKVQISGSYERLIAAIDRVDLYRPTHDV